MALTDDLKNLVRQFPAADKRGMLTSDIDKQQIEKTASLIAQGGKENIRGLVEMLGEPGTEENVKPHYALHCVVNCALVAKNEPMRKSICEAIAEQLTNQQLSDDNRAYLCQELQWAGRDEACAALGQVLLEDGLADPAAMALQAIGGERAAAQLRAAAGEAKGQSLRAIVDALAALADPKAAGIFHKLLTDGDREIRIAAGYGLAQVGDASSIEPITKAANGKLGWERQQQTKNCFVLAEKLASAGNDEAASKVYEYLRTTRKDDSEKYVHDLAVAALTG